MKNVFIFYGVEGSPNENWFPWLRDELEKLSDFRVFIPEFPTPEGQNLENWMQTMGKYKDFLNEDAILIGHSLGGLFALSILEKHVVKAGIFVASFPGLPGNKFDDGMMTFAQDFDWQKIRLNAEKFFVFHGDDNPYVKIEVGEKLARNLGVDVTLVKGAGHFNGSAGYTEFPLLLSVLRKI